MLILRYCFNFACLATAIGMTVYWFYKFWEDEDLVQVDVKPIELFPEGQFPMLSLCLTNVLIESKLKEYNNTLTEETFTNILIGQSFYDGIEKIDYDNVTLNLADSYVMDINEFQNGSLTVGQSPTFVNALPVETLSGLFYNQSSIKCIGLRPRLKNVAIANFVFNSSSFPKKSNLFFGRRIYLHLPNKISMAANYFVQIEKKAERLVIVMQQIELLRRRNKRKNACISDELSYDQIAQDEHLDQVGCKAPYQKTDKNLKICESKEKMKAAYFDTWSKINSMKSCTSASFTFTSKEAELDWRIKLKLKELNYDVFSIRVKYPDEYKEIVMVKKIDMQTVIGNSGGYIGLFLGNIISKVR